MAKEFNVDDLVVGETYNFSDDGVTWVQKKFKQVHYHDRRVFETEDGTLYEQCQPLVFIVTSNQNKLKEFRRIVPHINSIKGVDVKEVLPTEEDANRLGLTIAQVVAAYKALAQGKGRIVEDTILKQQNPQTGKLEEVVEIRWNQEDKLKDVEQTSWIVTLAYNTGTTIEFYEGVINGIVVEPKCEGFGFDPYFLPDGSEITLAELENEGKKDNFSARQLACVEFVKGRPQKTISIEDLPQWNGKYQNED